MKKLLLLLLLFPAMAYSQYVPTDVLEQNCVTNGKRVKRTYWHVLKRSAVNNAMTIFYRVSRVGEQYYLELKVTKGSLGFLVARNEPLEFLMDNTDRVVTLYNSEYQHSCKGCGSRADRGDKQGVSLTYPLSLEDMEVLRKGFVWRLRFYTEGNCMGAAIHADNSEIFHDQLWLVD